MVLAIKISPETEAQLRTRAQAANVEIEVYAAQTLERMAAPARTMLEISGPAYQEFLASGMTDDELGDLLEDVKHEARAERRRPTS